MSERPYSRIYHSIVDDPKFADVYDDDRRLATWLRLLIVAEQAHPASAYIPIGTHRPSVVALSEVGLIDLGTGSRYRIHGLDAERQRRSDAARVGGLASGRSRAVERPLNDRSTKSNLDETSRDETRLDEGTARENDPFSDEEGEALTWLAKHGCDVRPGNGYHRQLVTAVQAHGINAVIGMFDRLAGGGMKSGDTKGYVFGMVDALNGQSRPDLKVVEAEDREAERRSAQAKRLAATQVRLHENGAHFDSKSAACPRCKEATV